MENHRALTRFTYQENYSIRSISMEERSKLAKGFIKHINSESLYTIISVGIIDMRRQIVNSSRALYTLTDIDAILFKSCKSKLDFKETLSNRKDLLPLYRSDPTTVESMDYHLFIFFLYMYFTCPFNNISYDIWKQYILDMIVSYGIVNKYNQMLDFVFSAIVCDHRLTPDRYLHPYSLNSKFNNIIKEFSSERLRTIEDLENTRILKEYTVPNEKDLDSEYIESYAHHYEQALEFKLELEILYDHDSKKYISI